MNTFFIDALQQYGYPVLWLIVFISAAGIPVSGSLLLFASGAFAALGDFNIIILFPIALSATVMGDGLCYFVSRRVGVSLLHWLEHQKRFRFITSKDVEKSRVYFRQRAGWTVFITRFLIPALGGPVNLLAGLEQYPYPRFLVWDVSGQILSVLLSLGLGYIFAQSWEEVASVFGAISSLLLVLLIAIVIVVVLVRNIRRKRRIKQEATDEAEVKHITPQPDDTLEPATEAEVKHIQPDDTLESDIDSKLASD